jgi:hypothetical protein
MAVAAVEGIATHRKAERDFGVYSATGRQKMALYLGALEQALLPLRHHRLEGRKNAVTK